jgi:repressor of nif and glnA expression
VPSELGILQMTRRDEILQVLCDYADDHVGNSPSLRDLHREVRKIGYRISLSAVRQHVTKLEAERRLERKDGKLIVVGADWFPPDFSSGT